MVIHWCNELMQGICCCFQLAVAGWSSRDPHFSTRLHGLDCHCGSPKQQEQSISELTGAHAEHVGSWAVGGVYLLAGMPEAVPDRCW